MCFLLILMVAKRIFGGKVRNVDAINHPMMELPPLIRLRGARQSLTSDYPNAPLTLTPLDISQSPRLLSQQPIPNSRTPTISSHQIPKQQQQQQQFQDVLLFYPADGSFLFIDCLWINFLFMNKV